MSKNKEFDKRKKFIMELLGDPVYQPMRFREIAGLLRLSKEEKKDLYRVLDELVAEGKADLDAKGRYSKITGKKRRKNETGKGKSVSDRKDSREKQKEKSREKRRGREKEENEQQPDYENLPAYEGTFIGHPKGFGFVEIEGEDEDIFIPEGQYRNCYASG